MTPRPLSATAIAALTVAGTVVVALAGLAIGLVLIIAFVVADLAPATQARFAAADSGPSCSVTGDHVELRYPIATSRLTYTIYNAPRVRPDHLSGLDYLAVDTDPISPADDQPSPQKPQYRRLKVTDDSTVVVRLRLQGENGSADGLRFDWAVGEPAYTQTLPLTLRVTSSGCAVH